MPENTNSDKLLNEIELSMKDPDFISDMNEVMDDFKYIDAEIKLYKYISIKK